jgi:hypothetical protein
METRPLIDELKKAEEAVRRKIEELRKPVAQAEEDLRNILGTIAFYERSRPTMTVQITATASVAPATRPIAAVVGVFGAANLRGMTHKQAVIAIAKHSGGIVKAQTAKHLLIQAGVMRQTKNSTRMVHNAIINSDRFERIGPGEFRLKTPPNAGNVMLKAEQQASGGPLAMFAPKPPLQ